MAGRNGMTASTARATGIHERYAAARATVAPDVAPARGISGSRVAGSANAISPFCHRLGAAHQAVQLAGIEGVLDRVVPRDEALVEERLERLLHRHHARRLPGLQERLDLVRLA